VTVLSALKSTSTDLKAEIISWTSSCFVNRMQGKIIVETVPELTNLSYAFYLRQLNIIGKKLTEEHCWAITFMQSHVLVFSNSKLVL
jgi:hypothetical protein